uniref:Uncharacterized protein n=1 Tax=Ciona savignyi TaxID=51511 RepID=H2YBX6_CIOSA
MTSLRVLNLMGNPVVKKVRFYRKNLIVRLRQLTYLDDRPVFPRDRACAEAWHNGGHEAEKMERQRWVNKERQKIQESVDYLYNIRKDAEAKRGEEGREVVSRVKPVPMFDCDVMDGTDKTPDNDCDVIETKSEKHYDAMNVDEKQNDDVTRADDDITAEDDDITAEDDDVTMIKEVDPVTFDLDDLPDLEEVDIDQLNEEIDHSMPQVRPHVLRDNYLRESPNRILIEDITEKPPNEESGNGDDLEFGLD